MYDETREELDQASIKLKESLLQSDLLRLEINQLEMQSKTDQDSLEGAKEGTNEILATMQVSAKEHSKACPLSVKFKVITTDYFFEISLSQYFTGISAKIICMHSRKQYFYNVQ